MAVASGVRRSELGDALRTCRNAFIGVGVMSCAINVLYLTGSIFMLEVYDRVLPSRSVPTLIGLAILAGGMYLAQGILDLIRGRILGRIGTALDEILNRRVFDAMVRLPLIMGARNEGLQPLRDLDAVRSFLSGMGPGAFFDLPWLPFYLAICFAFHFMIGVTALVGAIILVGLTLATEYMSREPAQQATGLAARRNDLAATSRRNAEVVVAMGMSERLTSRWSAANEKYLAGHQRASDVAGGLGAISKVLRMTLQSAVLGVGAYLVIHQEATAGVIIAGSILSARALAPVDLAIAHWRSFVAARQSWHRLNRLLEQLPVRSAQTLLQDPSSRLSVETISIVPPGDQKIIVQEVSFALEAVSGLEREADLMDDDLLVARRHDADGLDRQPARRLLQQGLRAANRQLLEQAVEAMPALPCGHETAPVRDRKIDRGQRPRAQDRAGDDDAGGGFLMDHEVGADAEHRRLQRHAQHF